MEESAKLNIAVLGYGTIGSGVVEVFKAEGEGIDKKAGRPVRIKYVLDIRDFSGDPVEKILTHNIDDILDDDQVKIVVEVMGGVKPAYTFVKKALLKGKSVITSNKELVANHGAELLEIARSMNINFLFEASVGGGIPIIRPLNEAAWDDIYEINGILNGTTNYILTKMSRENRSLEDVLAEAQALGYAEKNPSADLEGGDTGRKIAILLSLVIGKQVDYENIYTEGITRISPQDLAYATALGGAVKLIARAGIKDSNAFARVSPVIVNNEHPLAMVNDVFNAIEVKGRMLDELMFYGRGAGKLPTAGAIVTDIIDCVKHPHTHMGCAWSSEKAALLPIGQDKVRKLVRVGFLSQKDWDEAVSNLKELFNLDHAGAPFRLEGVKDEFAFIAEGTENEIEEKLSSLIAKYPSLSIRNTIRFYE